MRMSSTVLALGVVFIFSADAAAPGAQTPQKPASTAERVPVLVELFTSEGCSSCPPADTLLQKLEEIQPVPSAQIIGLEEHVDYWNHDGWIDPFSDPEWTSRQQQYVSKFKGNTPYTPEMVVDGESGFTGDNSRAAVMTIRKDSEQPKAQVIISSEPSSKKDAERIEVRVGGASNAVAQEPADVWLAVTESGLQTNVTAGENSGKDVHHASVVRSFHKLGTLDAKDASSFDVHQEVKFKSSWKKSNLRIVVFVQERKSLRVLGVSQAPVAG